VGEDVKSHWQRSRPHEKAQKNAAMDYLFHLDALPERIAFLRRLEITGWLFHREGKPIHDLRAVLNVPGRGGRFANMPLAGQSAGPILICRKRR
jgi:hypothetical protein